VTCQSIPAASLALTPERGPGPPSVGSTVLTELAGCEVGVWEHAPGVSRDIEADEVFVVLAGHATVDVAGGPTLRFGPGDVGILQAGASTVWTVHETLRKVYITAGGQR